MTHPLKYSDVTVSDKIFKTMKEIRREAKEKANLNANQLEKLKEFQGELDKMGNLFFNRGKNLPSIIKDVSTYCDKLGLAGVTFILLLRLYDLHKTLKDQKALNGIDGILKVCDFSVATDITEMLNAVKGASDAAKDKSMLVEHKSAWDGLLEKVLLKQAVAKQGGHG